MKYAIWLIPQEPVYSKLKEIIKQLSIMYRGPQFEPHMTLVGHLNVDLSEVESKARTLAIGLDRLELSLGSVSFSTTYFQSVFVRINPTAKLMQLNLDCKKVFGRENDLFMPHMSLLYDGDYDMAAREKAASQVRLPSVSFIMDKFIIKPETLDPKKWKHLVTIPFR